MMAYLMKCFILLSVALLHVPYVSPQQIVGYSPRDASLISGNKTVLVLGSGGLVGTPLTQELKTRGYRVLEVRNRLDFDLRVHELSTAPVLAAAAIDFVFFLACEVGGYKFLNARGAQDIIWNNNMLIYDHVLPFLRSKGVKFLFTSSTLASGPSLYGRMKAHGEQRLQDIPNGKTVRLYNVYGPEHVGTKSHVISDWIHGCLTAGKVHSVSTGHEVRQLVYSYDIATALVDMMESFDTLPKRTELTTGQWTSMREVASLLSQYMAKPCVFHFSYQNSSTMKGSDPVQMWQVQSDIRIRLPDMILHYEGTVRHKPYLSIVICSTNDDYNGIRKRTWHFLNSVRSNAAKANLDYELIVVQYNPRLVNFSTAAAFEGSDVFQNDLPLSMLFPWTVRSGGDIQVLTVPSELHRWTDKGHVWEYIGKNAGAQRARGEYVLFLNPDDIVPSAIFERIAKGLSEKMYRAGLLVNWKSDTTAIRACEHVGLWGPCLYKGSHPYDPPALPRCPLSNASMHDLLGYKKFTDGEPSYSYIFLGDFLLLSKKTLHEYGGYPELPQNAHIDTAYYLYLKQRGVEEQAFDETVCHQMHGRLGRPQPQLDYGQLRDMLVQERSNGTPPTFGFAGQALPVAHLKDWQQAAYNPETPYTFHRHHSIFAQYPFTSHAIHEHVLTDFLGTKTRYNFDCAAHAHHRRFHIATRIACAQHDVFKTLSKWYLGLLPAIDIDYFTWVAVLSSAQNSLAASTPFTVVAVGARYGAWLVRAGMAARRLNPSKDVRLIAVEGNTTHLSMLREHLALNHLSQQCTVVPMMLSPLQNVTTAQLSDVLSPLHAVDVLVVNVKAAEAALTSESMLSLLTAQHKTLVIYTHAQDVHRQLRALLQASNWLAVADIPPVPGSTVPTLRGPVRCVEDGLLLMTNTRYL
jgi:nucleoside-diphosphate-sugar epimerase